MLSNSSSTITFRNLQHLQAGMCLVAESIKAGLRWHKEREENNVFDFNIQNKNKERQQKWVSHP